MPTAIYSDIHDEFLKDISGNILLEKDEKAIEVSIRNILGTTKGERIMLPTFGSNISSLLFEPIDENTARFIQMEIKTNINMWDDRFRILEVVAVPYPNKNQYNVTIQYEILRLAQEATLNIVLEAVNG